MMKITRVLVYEGDKKSIEENLNRRVVKDGRNFSKYTITEYFAPGVLRVEKITLASSDSYDGK